MQPYYHHDGVALFHGDARHLVEGLEADVVITDPVWPAPTDLLAGADDPSGLLRDVLARVKARRVVIQLGCYSDPRFLAVVPSRWPFIRACWLRYIPCSFRGRVLVTSDVAYAFGEPIPSRPGRRVISGECTSNQGEAPRREGRNRTHGAARAAQEALPHPTPRHLRHVSWLVNWFSEPGEVVLDPFAGSGTTLLASRNLDRKAIGVEVEERFCALCVQRLAQGRLALRAP